MLRSVYAGLFLACLAYTAQVCARHPLSILISVAPGMRTAGPSFARRWHSVLEPGQLFECNRKTRHKIDAASERLGLAQGTLPSQLIQRMLSNMRCIGTPVPQGVHGREKLARCGECRNVHRGTQS